MIETAEAVIISYIIPTTMMNHGAHLNKSHYDKSGC